MERVPPKERSERDPFATMSARGMFGGDSGDPVSYWCQVANGSVRV